MYEFLSITGLILLVAMAPGADFAIVTRNALKYSRKTAYLTSLGIGGSLIVHSVYSVMGLGVVISQSLLAFRIIKYAGAAYLIYLGIRSLFSGEKRSVEACTRVEKSLPAGQAFRQGFLCNLLNPKAPLFFISFFSMVIGPQTAASVQIFYGAEIVVVVSCWFLLLSTILSSSAVRNSLGGFQYYVGKVMGGFMVFLGVRIAALQQHTL